jgi:DNA-binding transcriptional ArsR family regulator
MLLDLAPPLGYSPDFLTPAAGTSGLEPGIDAIMRTSRQRLHADLGLLAPGRAPRQWVRSLSEADPATLQRLGAALRFYHEQWVAPYWDRVQAGVDADRARLGRVVMDHGHEGALAALHPSMRWDPPILKVSYTPDRDVYLDGRGMLLLPSFFCWRDPITLRDPLLPPVLVYPIEHDIDWFDSARSLPGEVTPRPLSALLGRTRAAVLQTIEGSPTTGEVARRLDISPASASEHATVLREAGLIMTRRHRNMVLHTLTPLGSNLLNGGRTVRA